MLEMQAQMLDMQTMLSALQHRRGNSVKTEFKCEPATPLLVNSSGVIDLTDD